MALTRAFRETVVARAERDRRFRQAMLTGAINELLSGDVEAGKFLLRDYINATITFDGLAAALDKPSKSLQRMFGPRGNPTAENIFAVLKVLQEEDNLFEVIVRAKGISGAVLSDQVKNLDWRARKATPKGKASVEELDEVRAKIAPLLGIR